MVRLEAPVCEMVLSESRKVPLLGVGASVLSRRSVLITPYAVLRVSGNRIWIYDRKRSG